MGDRPSNRALLDWLATEFVAQGWSVRTLHRMLVLSSTYRQSSASDEKKAAIDPENRLMWRMNRKRMEGESIRDAALAVSGSLNRSWGRSTVRVPLEPEVYDLIFTEGERDGLWPAIRPRRYSIAGALILYNKRSVRLPLLAAFDQPDAVTSCPVRQTSTHSLQALSLFNGAFMQEQSKTFAQRLDRECAKSGVPCRIRQAWLLTRLRGSLLRQSRNCT